MADIVKKTRRYPTDLTDEEWEQIAPKVGFVRRLKLSEKTFLFETVVFGRKFNRDNILGAMRFSWILPDLAGTGNRPIATIF